MGRILVGLAQFSGILIWLAGIAIHIWTTFIASSEGLLSAILTFIFPVVAQIYWGYTAWTLHGFNSPYIQWLFIYVVLIISLYCFSIVGTILEHRAEKKRQLSSDTTIDVGNPYYYGFGGWLYVVAFGAIISFGMSFFYSIDTLWPLYSNGSMQSISKESPTLALGILYETVFNVLNMAIIVFAAYQCIKLKRLFTKTMIAFYAFRLISAFLYFLIVSTIPEIESSAIESQKREIINASLTCAVWIPYFLRSKRVKNTFIY